MVEPALHGPVEVCLFSLLCSDILIDSGRGGACLSCWSRIGSSGKLLVYCSRRIFRIHTFRCFFRMYGQLGIRYCILVCFDFIFHTLILHSGVVSFLRPVCSPICLAEHIRQFFPVSFFCIVLVSFLFRIKFHHFSVSDRTITRCLGKFSFVFPSVFPAAVLCFCTKLSGICTKQNIFCTKTGGNSGMFSTLSVMILLFLFHQSVFFSVFF